VTRPPLTDPVAFTDLAAWCDGIVAADRFRATDDPTGIWHAGPRLVRAVGLLLDPWPGMGAWVAAERLDAVIVHRPWQIPLDHLGTTGVLAYHLAFDERLTLGDNPWLAARLGVAGPEVLGWKDDRPIGMLGTVAATLVTDMVAAVTRLFGGLDTVLVTRPSTIERIAVVGAMTDRLVREAADRGAKLYLTGQFRAPARPAIEATGMSVLTVGHGRSERWGLQLLASLIADRWPSLRVVIAPSSNAHDPTPTARRSPPTP